ncbi:MAG: DUF1292 domain-containing protein [Lachnospiraceae bacterium]|nr:DUF1292 domain-containing protein [Lachnospiraceae bacterium]
MEPKNYFKDQEDVQISLTFDDDTDQLCNVICIFPLNDKRYIVVSPKDGPQKDEMFIYGFEEDENDEPILSVIEDDDEYDAAADRFDELLDEEEFDEWVGEEE